MKALFIALLCLTIITIKSKAQSTLGMIPENFVQRYYEAYSGIPTAERLAPFYHDDVVLEDPTYDWVGPDKKTIFSNFTKANEVNEYTWRVDQVIQQDNTLVTEGELKAKYKGIPYSMRFVNIFHFKDGLIIKQYDYFDNADYYKAVEESKRK